MQKTDIIIVGAGISGICAAHFLNKNCPNKTFTILEARNRIGGTWDLFKYPGVRSDSDMSTLGFSFNPWSKNNSIASGEEIRDYVEKTAQNENIVEHIKFNYRVKKAEWLSESERWTFYTENTITNEQTIYTANFFICCAGYYKYENGFTPNFKNLDSYQGQFIHPQHWNPNTDYQNKKVVVIGSGATAITLVPALAETGAEKVTMLQRSPSYILAIPNDDPVSRFLHKILPLKIAGNIVKWKNLRLALLLFTLSRKFPNFMKKNLIKGVRKALPSDFDIEKHFTPTYKPWDQRLCLSPDGDFFKSIKNGKANVVTDHIEHFTEKGILLKSGEEIEADIVVSATGLELQVLGGMEVIVDGEKINVGEKYTYKSLILNDVPNMTIIIGSTNLSWTLRAELTSEYTSRLIKWMDKNEYKKCWVAYEGEPSSKNIMAHIDSNYLVRNADKLPKQGNKHPWKIHLYYFTDRRILKHHKIEDGVIRFE